MRWTIFPIAAVLLAGCVTMPQTRDEFRGAVAKGALFMGTGTHHAVQDFDRVSAVLKQQADECLNFNSTYSRQQGFAASTLTEEYYARFDHVNQDKAELVIQYIPRFQRVGPGMPEGGFYWMVIDIERQANGRAKLMYYGPSDDTKAYNAIRRWSDGEEVACPFS